MALVLGQNPFRAGRTLKAHAIMRSVTKRPLLTGPAAAKRDRRLARQIPLLTICVLQNDVSFNPQRTIGPDRNLYRFF
jgi:hypothetical protein